MAYGGDPTAVTNVVLVASGHTGPNEELNGWGLAVHDWSEAPDRRDDDSFYVIAHGAPTTWSLFTFEPHEDTPFFRIQLTAQRDPAGPPGGFYLSVHDSAERDQRDASSYFVIAHANPDTAGLWSWTERGDGTAYLVLEGHADGRDLAVGHCVIVHRWYDDKDARDGGSIYVSVHRDRAEGAHMVLETTDSSVHGRVYAQPEPEAAEEPASEWVPPERPEDGYYGCVQGMPEDRFDPAADAEYLHRQMSGLGTRDTNLLTALADRTNAQRQQIAVAYNNEHTKSLTSRVKSETSGKFEKVLVGLLTPTAEYDSIYLRKAMDGMGTSEWLLNEIICTRNGEELGAIQEAFRVQTDGSLIDRVAGETRGKYEKYLLACLRGNRPEGNDVDVDAAMADAQTLYEQGEAKWGTGESAFIEIIATRSFAQLAEICRQYERSTESNRTLIAAVQKEMSGNLENALVATLSHAFCRLEYWGAKIAEAMKGLGTDDDSLIRLIVSRSERDLGSIRDRFGSLSFGAGQSLEAWIAGDTSGHYEDVLLAIVQADQRAPVGL